VRELAPGVWHWEAPHPGWVEGEPWDPVVSSYALDDGDRVVLDVDDVLALIAEDAGEIGQEAA